METAGHNGAVPDQAGARGYLIGLREPVQAELALDGWSTLGASRTASEWFEADPRACFIVECSGRLRTANACGRQMLDLRSGISVSHGLLTFQCEASQKILRTALMSVCERGSGRVRRLVRANDAEWRMIWVVPTSDRTIAFVTVSQSDDGAEDDDVLTDAFGFTRTEARVMACLLRGETPKEVGGRLGMSINTVRSHLRGVYAKMNVRGLSGAIRLATRLTSSD